MKNEAFLPKKNFAGSKKHKIGAKGQARGEPGRSQKAPLTGLMVGEDTRDTFRIQVTTTNGEKFVHAIQANDEDEALKKAWHRTNKGGYDDFKLTILEDSKIRESVIIGPDENSDWTNPQVKLIGGAGSYTLDRLYKKAKGEASDIQRLIDEGEYKKVAFYLEQFKRTVDTIVAARDELSKRHFGEAKQRLDPKCWKGYRKQGTKVKDGVRVNNCVKVKEEWEVELEEMIRFLGNQR